MKNKETWDNLKEAMDEAEKELSSKIVSARWMYSFFRNKPQLPNSNKKR